MTREEFLNDLKNALSGMKEEEIDSVLAYYSEMLDDRVEAGMSEEDALNAMEPVGTIASRVLSEAGVEEDTHEEKESPDKEIRRSADCVKELHVTADNQRVQITSGETDEIVLRYRIEDGDIYQLHEENGVLTLEHTHRPVSSYKFDPGKITAENFFDEVGKFLGSINLGNIFQINVGGKPRCIEVVLPRVFKGKVKVTTSNSRIMADNVTCLDEVRLQSSNARIVLDHVVARTLHADTSNSRIVLEDTYVREQLDATTSNSSVNVKNVNCDADVCLRTSNGAIRVEMLEAKNITMKTSNASISGTVKGAQEDFAIRTATSNGRSNLSNSDCGEKQLIAKTSNSNINLEFIS